MKRSHEECTPVRAVKKKKHKKKQKKRLKTAKTLDDGLVRAGARTYSSQFAQSTGPPTQPVYPEINAGTTMDPPSDPLAQSKATLDHRQGEGPDRTFSMAVPPTFDPDETIQKAMENLSKGIFDIKEVSIVDAFAAEYDMEETEYQKNFKQAVKSEENISQAIELIKRDYRNGIMPSLRNMHKLVSDIMLVKRYCQDFYTVETLRMTLSIHCSHPGGDTQDNQVFTKSFWYDKLEDELKRKLSTGAPRTDNINAGISKLLAFLLAGDEIKFETLTQPFGTLLLLSRNFTIIQSFASTMAAMGKAPTTMVTSMSQLNFFIKRLVGAWYGLSDSLQSELIAKYPYIPEVLEKTPHLYDFISMHLKTLRLNDQICHKKKWSIDGLKKSGLWVSRRDIILYRERVLHMVDHVIGSLNNEQCYIYPDDSNDTDPMDDSIEVIMRHRRYICTLQALIIGLITLSAYGSRTQVMAKLTIGERKRTCDQHADCSESVDCEGYEFHPNVRVEWDLNSPNREKRPRSNAASRFEEAECITVALDRFIHLTRGLREDADTDSVFLPFRARQNGLMFSLTRKEFLGGEVNKAVKFVNAQLGVKIPQPSVMRHLYCTHAYLNWYEAEAGRDSRTFDVLITDLANDMNTSTEMVLNNYLCCRYSRLQLSDSVARRRAASKINQLVRLQNFTNLTSPVEELGGASSSLA